MRNKVLITIIVFVMTGIAALAANDDHGTLTVVHTFTGLDGQSPVAGLSADAAGNLYSTTQIGGASNSGTVFELTPTANGGVKFTTLYTFTGGLDGGMPLGTLIFDAQGNGYGTAAGGGADGVGVVYKLTPTANGQPWNETVLYSFQGGSDGELPFGELVFDAAGNLYGTTSRGGVNNLGCFAAGCGTIYELSPAASGLWQETILHNFSDSSGEGAEPRAGLVFDAAGNLYGTTNSGGNNSVSACNTFNSDGCGTVFELMPSSEGKWKLVTLVDFDFNHGALPRAGVTLDGKGNLFGATTAGGAFDGGVVFSLTEKSGDWSAGKLLSLPRNSQPSGNLALDGVGNLYGTTYQGGTNESGSVFQLVPVVGGWIEHVLYNFNLTGLRGGENPFDGVLIHNGALFLTTAQGGNLNDCAPQPGCGTVIELGR
jgi:uncharacterized repeat protein (TIGR03803 family)